MERTTKRDNSRAPGGDSRHFNRIFNGFSASGEKQGLARFAYRHQCIQPFGKLDIIAVRRDLETRMGKFFKLLTHRINHCRMVMPGIEHRNTRSKINIAFAFNIPNFGIFRFFDVYRQRIADSLRNRLLTP
ncbi:hypothetical protein D3C75_636350 [compost metagenome]